MNQRMNVNPSQRRKRATDDALGTAKDSVGESEAVLSVRRFGLYPTLPQNAREIFDSEKWISGRVLASSEREKLFDKRWMRHRLVRLQRCIKS